MRLNEGIVDGDDFDLTMLDPEPIAVSNPKSSSDRSPADVMEGYVRITEDDATNTAEAVDTDECLRHLE